MSHYKPDPNKNVNLTIDDFPVTVPEGTTILEAARKINVKIPTLCDHPDLHRRALCRLCVVECDGRSKLVAACANDVWEGVSIVTKNARIVSIRKMILELILANHPSECLSCIRNMNCELQTLAADFGIRSSSLQDSLNRRMPAETENEPLVRDMSKCVKCGRCVEVCQEVQTVRAINSSRRSAEYEICTPYGQALNDGPCIFCGQCAAVCPVGAIFEHDETAKVWAALNSKEHAVAAQIAPAVAQIMCGEFGLLPGTITTGMIITALDLMGFSIVKDAGNFADMTIGKESEELHKRIKNSGKLPMISCCSPGWIKFMEVFYPDLVDHLPIAKSPEYNFKAFGKEQFPRFLSADKSKTTFVSIMPCIAKKFAASSDNEEIVLTARELARMIRLAGIDLPVLHESGFTPSFDNKMEYSYVTKAGQMNTEAVLWKVYEAYDCEKKTADFMDGGIKEIELISGTKALIVNGFANARTIMERIRKGKCDAALVGIMACPGGCGSPNTSISGA